MEISGPAKPSSSFLMEMMAIPGISQRNTEFCIATVCHSCCFPVPSPQPLHPSAQGLTMICEVGRDLEDHTELQGWSLPPFPPWPGCSLHPIELEETWAGG